MFQSLTGILEETKPSMFFFTMMHDPMHVPSRDFDHYFLPTKDPLTAKKLIHKPLVKTPGKNQLLAFANDIGLSNMFKVA